MKSAAGAQVATVAVAAQGAPMSSSVEKDASGDARAQHQVGESEASETRAVTGAATEAPGALTRKAKAKKKARPKAAVKSPVQFDISGGDAGEGSQDASPQRVRESRTRPSCTTTAAVVTCTATKGPEWQREAMASRGRDPNKSTTVVTAGDDEVIELDEAPLRPQQRLEKAATTARSLTSTRRRH